MYKSDLTSPSPTVALLYSTCTYRLFGVVIEAADGEAQVWHPDVSVTTE
jgi:hypothetical protein